MLMLYSGAYVFFRSADLETKTFFGAHSCQPVFVTNHFCCMFIGNITYILYDNLCF